MDKTLRTEWTRPLGLQLLGLLWKLPDDQSIIWALTFVLPSQRPRLLFRLSPIGLDRVSPYATSTTWWWCSRPNILHWGHWSRCQFVTSLLPQNLRKGGLRASHHTRKGHGEEGHEVDGLPIAERRETSPSSPYFVYLGPRQPILSHGFAADPSTILIALPIYPLLVHSISPSIPFGPRL